MIAVIYMPDEAKCVSLQVQQPGALMLGDQAPLVPLHALPVLGQGRRSRSGQGDIKGPTFHGAGLSFGSTEQHYLMLLP
jgi:hypothetical protein